MNAGPPDPHGYAKGPAVCVRRGRRRLSPRRLAFSACKLAAGIFVLAIIGAGVLAFRLQQGPIEIDGLGQKIASALHDRFGGGIDFALGQTSMMQRGFGPTLAIDKLTVTGPDHQVILSAPKAEVSVDPFDLMFGKVAPKRLEVMDVTLRLVLLKNGALAVAAGDEAKPFLEIGRRSDAAPEPAVAEPEPPQPGQPVAPAHRAIAMKQAAAAIRQFLDILTDPRGVVAAIDKLGIARGKLVIDDRMTGEKVIYRDLDLVFDKARGFSSLTLSATGPSGRWTVAAMAQGRPGADRSFGLKVDNLSIDEMQLIAGTRSLGFESDMPIAMSVDLGLKADNTIGEGTGSFKLGPGFLRLDDPDDEPSFINEIGGTASWNSVERRIDIEEIAYNEAGGTKIVGTGELKPPHNEGDPWRVGLKLKEPSTLAPERKGQRPMVVDAGQFVGRLLLDQKTFQIDRLAFHGKEGGIALAGTVDWVKGPHIVLGAQIDPTTVPFAQRVWPALMASTVRAWIINHFEDGRLTAGTLKINYDQNALKRLRADRAPPDQSISLDFEIADGRLRYLDGVPPIEKAKGVGHITGRTSRFALTSGTIAAANGVIDVSDAVFFVPNSNRHPMPATLAAHVSGSVESVADILARDPLKPYASLPLDASTLHGKIEGNLQKAILLGQGTGDDKPDPGTLNVDAKVSDFVAEHLVAEENLENATVNILVGDGKLKATGQGHIFGGPATFEINRTGEGPPLAQIGVTLDEAARSRLGLAVIPGVSGPMTARVNASLGDPSKLKAQVDLDLGRTSIAAAYLGLVKPAGKPAKISFALNPRDNRMSIDQLVIDIASLQARGAVELGADNSFRSARFTSFKVSPGDDMRLDVSRGDDLFKLTIRGSTIDARPFLKALTSTPANDSTPLARSAKAEKKEIDAFKGFDIDLKTGILTGFNKEVMNAVELKLSKRGPQYRAFSVRGRFGGDAIGGSMGANQRLRITAQDAGALVSFIDLYKHMEGGNLVSTMQVSDETLSGNLEIRDFTLRDEPAIRSLVARSEAQAAPGQEAAARRINAGAVPFKRLKVNFERAGSRLQLSDANMFGDEIGLSVDGWLDYVHNRVAMNGTFVPAYALNNMFAQIPVFGAFLGGKSNEGLLAITFRISGAASTPTLQINPLSAIPSGILRNIFGVLDQGGTAPPGAAEPDLSR